MVPLIGPGAEITVDVTDLSHDGEGVARWQGQVVFIPLALPGDRVRAKVTEVKKRFLRGQLVEVIEAGPARCQPRCPSFGRCGGCHIQHLDYRSQLEYKTHWVREVLTRIGGLEEVPVLPTLGMENPWHYRNKIRLHVVAREGQLRLGLYAPGSHAIGHWMSSDGACYLLDGDLINLAGLVEKLLNQYYRSAPGCPAWLDCLTHVTLRKAAATGETMVVLEHGGNQKGSAAPERRAHKIYSQDQAGTKADGRASHPRPTQPLLPEVPARLIEELAASGQVTTMVQQVGGPDDEETSAGQTKVLYGPGYITDGLDHLSFRLSAASFYQVNPVQTRVLYHQVLHYAHLTGREQVLDAYCGVGTIALFLARHCRQVLGLELSSQAVADARDNARLNHMANVCFRQGQVERLLPELLREGYRPDVVVLDPPRRGCHRLVAEALASRPVPRLVYVSCDPGTLARDLSVLAANSYQVLEVQPVDMFPHTHHIECVVSLKGKSIIPA